MGEGHSRVRTGLVVPEGFLRRKFIAPNPPASYASDLPVARLVDNLGSWRICSVSAPCGYGKTSLLAHWHQVLSSREGRAPLWIALDGKDNDPGRLVASLCTALQGIDHSFVALAEAASHAGDAADVEATLTEAVNLLDEVCDSETQYVLMLDDVSAISSPETAECISFLALNSGDNVKFIFSGTSVAPAITDLFLDAPAVRVEVEELSLNGPRMRSLVESLFPRLTAEEVDELCRRAGGWPMELAFARLAASEGKFGREAVEEVDRLQARYFERKVTDGLDRAACEFLVETSMLDSLEPALCDAVTQCGRSKAMIEALRDRSCFVLRNGETGVYSYQPSFKRFLQEKWLSMCGSVRGSLARRAAEWCLANGIPDAYRKYLALACDPFFLDASVAASTGLRLPVGCPSLAEHLVSRPAPEFRSDPYLVSIALWSAISTGFVGIARDCIGELRACGAGSFGEAGFLYADALCDAIEGDSASSLAKIEAILADDRANLPRPLECLLLHMAAENTERLGDIAGSRALYQRSLSLSEREGSAFYRMFDRYLMARQNLDLGKLDEALALAHRCLEECPPYTSLYGEFNTIIAYVHIQRHELDEAARCLDSALEAVSVDSNADVYVDTQVAFARLAQARGDCVGALETLSSLSKAISGKAVPRNMSIEAYSVQAAIAAQIGDRLTAYACEPELDGFLDNPDLLRAIPCMQAKAHILRMKGERDACRMLMERCREKAVACASPYFIAQIAVFMAEFNAEEGNDVRAAVELGRAIEISMFEGYKAVFLRGGPHVKALLLKQATSRKASSNIRRYAKELLACFDGEDRVESQIAMTLGDVSGYYALSEREREILRYLNNGMSRYEIAERLSLSENTVKTHLKNIYSKLGVHTRAEAFQASMDFEDVE